MSDGTSNSIGPTPFCPCFSCVQQHRFCLECISKWATEGATVCPVCRSDVVDVKEALKADDGEVKNDRLDAGVPLNLGYIVPVHGLIYY